MAKTRMSGRQAGPQKRSNRVNLASLDKLIAEATVDCYDESEQITGIFTMLEENLAVPFKTTLLGMEVTVERIDMNDANDIVAVCRCGRERQRVPILDLPLPEPRPRGAEEESYLAELVRYIHLNLLRAGVVKDLGELRDCPWSGHSALMSKMDGREWQNRDYVLSYFGGGRRGRRNYLRFMEEGISLGRRPELVGGGLVRSLGGWSSVIALRRRGEKEVSDKRILGDGGFVEAILAESEDRGKENLRVGQKKVNLLSLAEGVCRGHGVNLEELRSGSRRHTVVKARQELSRLAVVGHGYSGAEVARYLGVTNSCITRPLSLETKQVW